MMVSKSIEEMDREFAKIEGISYHQFKAMTLTEQYNIKRNITNKKLKNQNRNK
jgi:hypothetical protein